MLGSDVLADDSEHLACGQFFTFPVFDLLVCGIFRWFLVAELGYKCFCLLNVPVQYGMGFQFIHILGEPVFERFQFLAVYPVGFPHEVNPDSLLHRPCLPDAVFQLFHRNELVRIVGLHFDVA